MVVGGVGVGALGGFIAGHKLRAAESISQQTFDFMNDKPFSKLPKGVIDVHDGMFKARTKLNAIKKFSTGTRIAASAIAFAGIHKLIQDKKDSNAKEMAKIGAAAIASEAVTRGIYAGFKRRNPFTVPLKQATKSGGVTIMNEFLKKVFSKGVKAAI